MVFWGKHGCACYFLYCVNSVRQDRIPFFSDVIAFSQLAETVSGDGGYSALDILFFIIEMFLILSLFVFVWYFFQKNTIVLKFAFIQEVFRRVSFRCPVSIFPLLVSLFGIAGVWVNLFLFVLSEALKVASLLYVMKSNNRKPWVDEHIEYIKRKKYLTNAMTITGECLESYCQRTPLRYHSLSA